MQTVYHIRRAVAMLTGQKQRIFFEWKNSVITHEDSLRLAGKCDNIMRRTEIVKEITMERILVVEDDLALSTGLCFELDQARLCDAGRLQL